MLKTLPDLLDFEAFFFDFDGLLVDTEPLHYLAYQKMLQKHQLLLPWDFATYCHYAHQKTAVFAEAIYQLFPSLKKKEPNWMLLREEKVAIYQALLLSEPVALMPGVETILKLLSLHGKAAYVVTNATKEQIEAIRPQHEVLKTIKAWITREEYEHPKPAPDGYLKALGMHSKRPCKAIGFEDAIRGVEALQAASLAAVWIIPPGYPTPDNNKLEGVYVFCSFEELLQNQGY